jgi:ribosomal protein S6
MENKKMYESITILQPEATEKEIKDFIKTIQKAVEANESKVKRIYKEGVQPLAYGVRSKGYYITFYIEGKTEAILEVERIYRIKDLVIKFMITRLTPDTTAETIKQTEREIAKAKYQETKERIIAKAQEWQREQRAFSWGEVAEIQSHFEKMARRYGLIREFKENGII